MTARQRWVIVVWSGLAVASVGYLATDSDQAIFSHHIAWLLGAVCGAWAFHRKGDR